MDAMEQTAPEDTKEIRETLDAKDLPVFKASAALKEIRATLVHRAPAGRKVCRVLVVRRAETASMVNR